ncbi:hypothetical protein Mnod_2998 [Methylobacterium nodulans ORS 2060]|uniref:Uncharacterized protein n=1 Tax=Methylobacterium nodulans (strain LMG 21967 / CNCM I-2342 / ORS 2060) TaxID=460265 RepID=B8II73_METNO|nr:hypothetical protein Mnod_2998 [Methylobacterium nodulans ORS 2060]
MVERLLYLRFRPSHPATARPARLYSFRSNAEGGVSLYRVGEQAADWSGLLRIPFML